MFRNMIIVALMASTATGCGGAWFGEKETLLPGERIAIRATPDEQNPVLGVDAQPALLPVATTNAEWPQMNGSAARVLGHPAFSGGMSPAWTVRAGSGAGSETRITAQPVVAAGRIYILDANSTVAALDASSGAAAWSVSLTPESENAKDGFGGGLAYAGGQIFVATGFGEVKALDAASGSEIWSRRLGAPIRSAPAVDGGRVLVTTRDNRIAALDAATGAVNWSDQGVEEPAGVLGGGAPAISGGVAVGAFTSGELAAYDAATGRRGWLDVLSGATRSIGFASINDVAGDPVIANGAVYAASQSGRLVAVDLLSGERRWTRDYGSVEPVWAVGDYLYLVTNDARVVCLNAASGAPVWVRQLEQFSDPEDRYGVIAWSGPVVAGGRVLVVSNDGRMVSLSPENGDVLGTTELSDGASVAPVVASGTVYVLTDDGRMTAYR